MSLYESADINSVLENLTISFIENLDCSTIIQEKTFIDLLISLHPSDLYDKIIAKLNISLKCSNGTCRNRAITLPCKHKLCKKCSSSRCPKCSEFFSVNAISVCDKMTCLSCFKSLSSRSFNLNSCAHSCMKCCYRRILKNAKTCKICMKDISQRPIELRCDRCNGYYIYHEFYELQCSHILCKICTEEIKNTDKCEVCLRMLSMEDYYGIRMLNKFCCEGCESVLNLSDLGYTECCGKGMCTQCLKVKEMHRGCRGGGE